MFRDAQVSNICIPEHVSGLYQCIKQCQGMLLGTGPVMIPILGFLHQSHFRGSIW